MKRVWILIVFVVGCHTTAGHQTVHFSSLRSDTGQLELIFPRRVHNLSVTLNGRIVVRQVNAETLLIRHIPTGTADVIVSADAVTASTRVWIDDSETTTLPIGVQGPMQKSAGMQMIYSLVAFVISQSINEWLFNR